MNWFQNLKDDVNAFIDKNSPEELVKILSENKYKKLRESDPHNYNRIIINNTFNSVIFESSESVESVNPINLDKNSNCYLFAA